MELSRRSFEKPEIINYTSGFAEVTGGSALDTILNKKLFEDPKFVFGLSILLGVVVSKLVDYFRSEKKKPKPEPNKFTEYSLDITLKDKSEENDDFQELENEIKFKNVEVCFLSVDRKFDYEKYSEKNRGKSFVVCELSELSENFNYSENKNKQFLKLIGTYEVSNLNEIQFANLLVDFTNLGNPKADILYMPFIDDEKVKNYIIRAIHNFSIVYFGKKFQINVNFPKPEFMQRLTNRIIITESPPIDENEMEIEIIAKSKLDELYETYTNTNYDDIYFIENKYIIAVEDDGKNLPNLIFNTFEDFIYNTTEKTILNCRKSIIYYKTFPEKYEEVVRINFENSIALAIEYFKKFIFDRKIYISNVTYHVELLSHETKIDGMQKSSEVLFNFYETKNTDADKKIPIGKIEKDNKIYGHMYMDMNGNKKVYTFNFYSLSLKDFSNKIIPLIFETMINSGILQNNEILNLSNIQINGDKKIIYPEDIKSTIHNYFNDNIHKKSLSETSNKIYVIPPKYSYEEQEEFIGGYNYQFLLVIILIVIIIILLFFIKKMNYIPFIKDGVYSV